MLTLTCACLRCWLRNTIATAKQEYVLSPRKLRHVKNMLRWECTMAYCQEDTPLWNQISNIAIDMGKMVNTTHNIIPVTPDLVSRQQVIDELTPLSWWYDMVINYVRRDLTFKIDVLPAIAALAQDASNRTGYQYLAGVWAEDFRRGLVWESHGSKSDSSHCPWSWLPNSANAAHIKQSSWLSLTRSRRSYLVVE